MAEKDIFEYTYSVPQQSEVQKIREKYLPKEVTKLDQLRALDAGVTKRGTAVSLVHGILYALVLGPGVAATYPIYNRIVKQDRERIAPEILRLTEELAFGE